MRTTLVIDLDVLQAARELAELRSETIGQVVSALARKGLEASAARGGPVRHGVPLLPRRNPGAPKPTMKLVNQIRDEA